MNRWCNYDEDRQNEAGRAGQGMALDALDFPGAAETTLPLLRTGDDALGMHDPGRLLRPTAVGFAHTPSVRNCSYHVRSDGRLYFEPDLMVSAVWPNMIFLASSLMVGSVLISSARA